jgi:hypothetical protein
VDQHDLLGSKQVLGDRERADLVVRDHAASVADHVGVTELEPEDRVGVETGIHACDDRDLSRRRFLSEIAFPKPPFARKRS